MNIRYFSKRGQTWLDFKDAAGKRHRVPSGCITEADAIRQAPSILARVLGGASTATATPKATPSATEPPARGPTIEDAFKHAMRTRTKWMESKDKPGLERIKDQLVAYFGPQFRLSEATRTRVQKWREDMMATPGQRKGTKLSNSTINHKLTMLSVLLEENDFPPHTVRHLSVEGNRRARRTREEELQAVISWCFANHTRKDATTLADMVQVALATTARRSELLGLLWTDVYFDRNCVMFRNTKNGTNREVAVADVAMRVLERRVQYGNLGPFHGVAPSQITALWNSAKEALGLSEDHEFVFHVATRHEGLSRLGDQGASAFQIKAFGGHKSIAAADRYVKPEAESLRELANGIMAPRP